ncbi:MAG TPA: hypothetical protein VEJ23_10065 [Solirubrobacteraceae bacterium]|nr:hypothetical protein [Solirubrobacteraceae bacterium]
MVKFFGALGAAAVLVTGAVAIPTGASASGVLQATIPVTPSTVIKSVTISPTSVTFGESPGTCTQDQSTTTKLQFPNGVCTAPKVTVTDNGSGTNEQISVNGADAVPSDMGTNWALTSNTSPGSNEYRVSNGGAALTTTATCDSDFTQCASVSPNSSQAETLTLTGPTSSTDQSTSFSTQVTWTAS